VTDLGLPRFREVAVREVAPDFPRDWVEFVDPADPEGLVRAAT